MTITITFTKAGGLAPGHPPLAHPNYASGIGGMPAYAGGFVNVKMSGVMKMKIKIKMKEFRIGDFGICIGKRISAVGKVNRRGADRLSSMAKVMQGRVI